MINMIKDSNPICTYLGIALITINLLFLFGGILGDPGVKDLIYLNYTKERYGKQSETEEVEDDIEMSTIDSKTNGIKKRKREQAKNA